MLFAALKCLDLLERPPEAIRRLRAMIVEHMLEVVRAQVGDLALGSSDDDAVGLAAWLEVARLRVGGLFSMGLVGAAILADAEPRTIRALGPLGGHLGIIFTVQDELLDVLGGPGRRRGQALVDGHANLITRLALHRASPADREALRSVLHAPAHATHDDAIATAITLLDKDGAIEQALDILREHQEAVTALARGPLPGPLADVLTDLADALLAPLRDRVAKT
jgi:geranylgeranyl pyrophosphate synthase